MGRETKSTFTVFYSWQSDSDPATNHRFIKSCIKQACLNVEESPNSHGMSFKFDEATREEPGSPNIPLTILKKIAGSDAIICDVTTITPKTSDPRHKLPNANVVFELGFAVAQLGWDRVILLFNEAHGTFPDDLPFDFDRHRVSRYSLSSETATNSAKVKEVRNGLIRLFKTALEQIAASNPKRPTEHEGDTPENIQKNRDVKTLRQLLSHLPISLLDNYVEEMPDSRSWKIGYVFSRFHSIWNSSITYIYNHELREILSRIDNTWQSTNQYGNHYISDGIWDSYKFNWKNTIAITNSERITIQKDYQELGIAADALGVAINDLVKLVRSEYLEIDLNETMESALAWYDDHFQEIKRRINHAVGVDMPSENQ